MVTEGRGGFRLSQMNRYQERTKSKFDCQKLKDHLGNSTVCYCSWEM